MGRHHQGGEPMTTTKATNLGPTTGPAVDLGEGVDADALIARWITPDPHVKGLDRAIVGEYGTSVWALVALWRGRKGDIAQVARDHDLPEEAVRAALAYYDRHRILIDHRIWINSSDSE